jgi:pimeloyl-[acyl-carrier protein] methyl ester esterase
MLPGLDGTGLLFRPLMDVLPVNLKPIVVSFPTDKKLGYEDLLPLVIKELPKSEPFILLGESFSGPLSILVAATRPQGLIGIILCASFITCPQHLVPKWSEKLVFAIPFRASSIFVKVSSFFGQYYSDEFKRALSLVKPEVFAHRIKEVIKVNVVAELETCNIPILYLQGKNDCLVPSSNFDKIKKLKPDIQRALLETSHMVLQTKPNEASSLINNFIENIN